ncbi:hypothetical protein QQF64_029931 [Cirrhinus molitorella]|uniref:Uncharacterized protein n=1 Tax=Cirrhinus molitorella TaxID=172907 RepID=A0ABR3N202_9TELE
MHCTTKWLKITAANRLPLPYLGYVKLDIQVLGVTLPGCEFVVVHDLENLEDDTAPPGIIGMNIAQHCKQLILAEFDNALEGALDSEWRAAFTRSPGGFSYGGTATVRVAGEHGTHIPAGSVATIKARIHKGLSQSNGLGLFEPTSMKFQWSMTFLCHSLTAEYPRTNLRR